MNHPWKVIIFCGFISFPNYSLFRIIYFIIYVNFERRARYLFSSFRLTILSHHELSVFPRTQVALLPQLPWAVTPCPMLLKQSTRAGTHGDLSRSMIRKNWLRRLPRLLGSHGRATLRAVHTWNVHCTKVAMKVKELYCAYHRLHVHRARRVFFSWRSSSTSNKK